MDFRTHLLKYLNDKEIDKLLDSFNDNDKHALLLNERKMSKETLLSIFPNLKKHPLVNNGFIYDKNEYDLGKSIYHELGCFYLQEPSAMVVSFLLDLSKDDIVLDMCAAPGGKSIGASFKMNNEGVIYSNDLSRQRASIIVENIERLGISNLLITNNDFSLLKNEYKDYFTKIILDAPCSGSGMFRKDSKMKEDWSINKVYKFSEIQKQLIIDAYSMLKPGGILSYSTCSYSYEEDEEVIQYLLDSSDAQLVDLPKYPYLYQSSSKLGIHLFPHLFNGEGHYICQIKKPGELKYPEFKIQNKNNYHLEGQVNEYGSYLFALPKNVKTNKLNIVRYGLKIGEKGKDFIKYDYHYARSLLDYKHKIELDGKEVKDYLTGNVIKKITNIKGYVLLTYKNIPVDLAKSDGNQIKNHYPKGLRKITKFY